MKFTEEQRQKIRERMVKLWADGFYSKYALGRGMRQRYFPHRTNKDLIIDIWR